MTMDKKIVDFGRFFEEKSDFGDAGEDFGWKNRVAKNSEKIGDFSPIFGKRSIFTDFSASLYTRLGGAPGPPLSAIYRR